MQYYNAEILQYYKAEILQYYKAEILQYYKAQILQYYKSEILQYYKAEILHDVIITYKICKTFSFKLSRLLVKFRYCFSISISIVGFPKYTRLNRYTVKKRADFRCNGEKMTGIPVYLKISFYFGLFACVNCLQILIPLETLSYAFDYSLHTKLWLENTSSLRYITPL